MNKITLKNSHIQLSFVPEFGCHWTELKFNLDGQWVDLLYPVPNIDQLPKHPMRDGSYLLAPWSNRLEKARFTFKGKSYKLKSNFPDKTAIHGDVGTRPWSVRKTTRTRFQAILDSSSFSNFNYPFKLRFYLQMELEESGLKVLLKVANQDNQEVPVGLGFHPFWKRRLTVKGTDIILKVPAEKMYPVNEGIPQRPAESVPPDKDLSKGQDLYGVSLDDCYTGLTSQECWLTYIDPGVLIKYSFDDIFKHVVVYSLLDKKGTPKDFVAVEPMTNVTNGFNLLEKGWVDTGVKILKPQDDWGGTWTLNFAKLNP